MPGMPEPVDREREQRERHHDHDARRGGRHRRRDRPRVEPAVRTSDREPIARIDLTVARDVERGDPLEVARGLRIGRTPQLARDQRGIDQRALQPWRAGRRRIQSVRPTAARAASSLPASIPVASAASTCRWITST